MPPNLTNATTVAQQVEQSLNNAQSAVSTVASTTLSSLDQSQSVLTGIANKLNAAGSSVAGAASAALNQLGGVTSTLTKFKDSLGVAEKIREIRPEGTRGKRTQSARLMQFPLDLGHYFIKFSFKSAYQTSKVLPRKELLECTIYMPLPNDLNERYSVQYAEKQLGVAGLLEEAGLMQAAQDIMKGEMTSQKAEEAGRRLGATVGAPGNAAYLLRAAAGKGLGDTGTAAIDRATGSVLNPYQALQFQGIDLRSHSFRFRCSPNSEAEAAALKTIIQEFKIRMLPEKAGLLFNFPDVCTIEFQTKNMPYSFKNCYLKSMGVNYAPQGTPSFFKGGKYPTEVEISLEFGEVEPVTRNDVQAAGGDLTQAVGQNSVNKPSPVKTEGTKHSAADIAAYNQAGY